MWSTASHPRLPTSTLSASATHLFFLRSGMDLRPEIRRWKITKTVDCLTFHFTAREAHTWSSSVCRPAAHSSSWEESPSCPLQVGLLDVRDKPCLQFHLAVPALSPVLTDGFETVALLFCRNDHQMGFFMVDENYNFELQQTVHLGNMKTIKQVHPNHLHNCVSCTHVWFWYKVIHLKHCNVGSS